MSTNHSIHETFPSDLEQAERIQSRIIALLEELAFPARDVFGMRLALEEAIVNAIKHGNQMDPSKMVCIQCDVDAVRARVIIEDEGVGFDPTDVPDPTAEENIEKPGGRGIMLMKAFMTTVEYNERGNRVVLEKVRDGDGEDEGES